MFSQNNTALLPKTSVWVTHEQSNRLNEQLVSCRDLEPLYDEIVRAAIFTARPDNIATFPGQRITYNCKKEIGANYNQRIPGTRIKHHMGDVSIKMYDKFDHVLRIESACNDIGTFRVKRKAEHRDGSSSEQKTPLKKHLQPLPAVHDYESSKLHSMQSLSIKTFKKH